MLRRTQVYIQTRRLSDAMAKKSSAPKYYAVRVGREGANIYDTWSECHKNVSQVTRYPSAEHKSFTSRLQAEEWILSGSCKDISDAPGENSSTSVSGNVNEELNDALSSLAMRSVCGLVEPPPAPAVISQRTGERVQSTISIYPQLSLSAEQDNAPGYTSGYSSISADRIIVESNDAASSPAMNVCSPVGSSPAPINSQQAVEAVRYAIKGPVQPLLSAEQENVLRLVKEGENVFFTGSAGTGKSFLLQEVIKALGGRGSPSLAITASTGIASVSIGGTTLHSWAGIGLGKERARDLAAKVWGQQARNRWQDVRTLIIDEISMIDGELFDKLEYIACYIRGSEKPFGDIQLVLSGDFCQLPPVPDRRDGVAIPVMFAFEARSWNRCIRRPVQLSHVFRQKEQEFIEMLNAMRFGNMTPLTIEKFRELSRHIQYRDDIEPTEIFPTRRDVDNANRLQLRRLPGSSYTFLAMDAPGYDERDQKISEARMSQLLERLVVPGQIELKVGAQVMLVKNLIQGELVNGSVGKVVAFSKYHVGADGGGGIPQPDDYDVSSASERQWPIVQFTSGRTSLISPVQFVVNNARGGVEASREQVPLILAWALSVHKSQGQTLERVKVNLAKTFEKGQAYVALSRATSMETLEVLNFSPDKVMVHPRVASWYRELALKKQEIDPRSC